MEMIEIDRTSVGEPQILIDNNTNNIGEKAMAILYYEKGIGKKPEEFSIYRHSSVKEALSIVFNKKCAYCESIISHVSYPHIEHWRPKKGVTENLSHRGYYWLASEWENLLLACGVCNSTYKKNKFPLGSKSKYALKSTEDYLKMEKPLLINPCLENPEKYFKYFSGGAVKSNYIKGKKSIEIYGLYREDLTIERGKIYGIVKLMLDDIYTNITEITELYQSGATGKVLRESIKKKKKKNQRNINILKEYIMPNYQYAGMSRFIIKQYRKKMEKNLVFLKEIEELKC